MVQVKPAYDPAADVLALTLPDGGVVSGVPKDAEPLSARFFGQRDVAGVVVDGPWAEALSALCGLPLRLVRSQGNSFDALPLSILSSASVDALRASSGETSIDERRFRPNVYLDGMDAAHGEDAWVGREVSIGGARARVVFRDPRCDMTTHDPDTGARDFNTLKLIAAYRTDQPKEVNFGVYGAVDHRRRHRRRRRSHTARRLMQRRRPMPEQPKEALWTRPSRRLSRPSSRTAAASRTSACR